jgi:peptidoglycan/xylan/chitin deacetylase (PgdA/CDA1 family)
VVLFHDGGGPREQTIEAVRQLLPWLQEQGYQFVLPS